MMMTIERVIFLRGISFFAECGDDVLADLASTMEEQEILAGERIIERGDQGNSMYVIVDGSVQVHHNQQAFTAFGPREVFGELSALDPEPRSAHVFAVSDTLLLKLEHMALMQLIEQNPDVSKEIIRFLCKRFREATK